MGLGLVKSTFLYFMIVINLIFVSSLWCIDRVRESLCEPNFLCTFVLRNTSGQRVFVDSCSLLLWHSLDFSINFYSTKTSKWPVPPRSCCTSVQPDQNI